MARELDLYPEWNNVSSSLALNNTIAFNNALREAKPGDTVLVPDGKSFVFIGGILAQDKHLLTIDVAGSAHFLYDRKLWPFNTSADSPDLYAPCITTRNCSSLTITSSSKQRARVEVNYRNNMVYLVDSNKYRGGLINGNGKQWWNDCIKGNLPKHGDSRPRLIYIKQSTDVHVEKLTLLNSPFWTLVVAAVRAEVQEINVLVDRAYQASLLETNDSFTMKKPAFPIPVFPIDDLPDWVGRRLRQPQDLNTDGIDAYGRDIWIHDCIIQNADDSVAVKPLRKFKSGILPSCTSNVTVENMVLTGFGASVGSVGPVREHNCIDNITFRNITMPGTGKGERTAHWEREGSCFFSKSFSRLDVITGIYIKSNGFECKNNVSASITNIL